jgi:hypothetical protein
LKKEIEEDRRCSWIGIGNGYTTKSDPQINFRVHQNPNVILHINTQIILKFISKHKRPWIAKAVQSKQSNAGGSSVSDFKSHYRVIVTKTT